MFCIFISGYNFSKADLENTKVSVKTYHEIIEAMKFAYSVRSYMGDDLFLPNMTQVRETFTFTDKDNIT